MFDFGLRIQNLRIKKGLSQEALGKKIGRSKSVICGYESNTTTPPLDILVQLAVIFNVSLDYLVGIDKNEMISLSNLTDNQKDLIHLLISELKALPTNYPGLTEKEQDILNRIMIEFHRKHK